MTPIEIVNGTETEQASFAAATGSVKVVGLLVGVCNCGHFEPHYDTHETCPECAVPWHVMHWLQAMHYLNSIYEDEQKLRRYWKERCETLNSEVTGGAEPSRAAKGSAL